MKEFLLTTMKQAGIIAMQHYKNVDIEFKNNPDDPIDPVTKADKEINSFFIAEIQKQYPDHGIVSEEADPINSESEYQWYIDPIDGTTNFAYGIPFWCIIAGLRKGGNTILAAVYNPVANDMFFAEEGRSTTLNGTEVQCTDVSELSNAKISTFFTPKRPFFENYLGFDEYLYNELQKKGTRHMGSMLAACHMASGGFDVYMRNGSSDHDYVAPAFICQQAGGVVTDAEGNEWKPGRKDIVFTNKHLHKQVIEILNR